MLPIEPLMQEHRVIERMIRLMNQEIQRVRQGQPLNAALLEAVVDFLRSYADRCHHGKEEEILFRELAKKPLSSEHQKMMNELAKEHVMSRRNVSRLVEDKNLYLGGNKDVLTDIISHMEVVVKFYPLHIDKEDKHFFVPSMSYFNVSERQRMLEEFRDFDQKLFFERYSQILDQLEKSHS
jgi:hemerythrin-like domain-containing protein